MTARRMNTRRAFCVKKRPASLPSKRTYNGRVRRSFLLKSNNPLDRVKTPRVELPYDRARIAKYVMPQNRVLEPQCQVCGAPPIWRLIVRGHACPTCGIAARTFPVFACHACAKDPTTTFKPPPAMGETDVVI